MFCTKSQHMSYLTLFNYGLFNLFEMELQTKIMQPKEKLINISAFT